MEELLASGDKNDGMRKLLDLLHKVQSSPLAQEEGIAQQLVESTVTVLDLLGVDLISQRIQGLRFKYQRQLGTSSVWNNMSLSGKYQGDRDWMFMTNSELKKQLEKLPSGVLKSPTPVTLSQLRTIQQEWSEKVRSGQEEEIEWYVPFLLNEQVGGMYSLSFKSKNLSIRPRSELPVQDVVAAYLQCGVPSVGGLSQIKEQWKQTLPLSRDEFNHEMDDLWQFVRTTIPKEERVNLATYLKKDYLRREAVPVQDVSFPIIKHYQKEFGENRGMGDVDVIITRSGVSANAVALDFAKEWVGENIVPIFEGKGWYFENSSVNAPDPQVQIVEQFDQAQVLLINAESNAPLGPNVDNFYAERNKFIRDFLSHAAGHPKKRFAIVLDKTCNSALTPEQLIKHWPANVKLLETVSLTKHQRGGRGYFYGLVLAHGLNLTNEQIDEKLQNNRGEMTLNSWIGMPKLTKAEILRRREKIVESIQAVVQNCQTSSLEAGFIIEPYSYYFFLYPNSEKARMQQINQSADRVVGQQNKAAKSILDSVLDNGKYPNVEQADSFNLNTTRISLFDGVQMEGVKEYPNVIRISPGVNTRREELVSLVEDYISGWSS